MFIYFITYLITFIDSVLTLGGITQVMCNVSLLDIYQSYNALNKYNLPITHTYIAFMKQCQGLTYRFHVMHKVLSSHHIFIMSDLILKIPGTCIDYTFTNQSMFT